MRTQRYARHQTLLGVALAVISATKATGQIVVPPDTTFSIPNPSLLTVVDYELAGGTLAPGAVNLTGTLNLTAPSTISRPRNPIAFDSRGNPFESQIGPTNLNGPIVGPSDLTLENLSRDELFVNGDNSYSGETRVTAGRILATSPTALGSATGATIVAGADLVVRAPTAERFRVEGGSLSFEAGDFVPSEPLVVAGGEVRFPSLSLYDIPIVAAEGAGGTVVFPSREGDSWTGGSSGVGDLTVAGRLNVDAPLTHDGDLTINGARLNAVNTYTGKTTIIDRYVIDRGDVFGTSTTPIEIRSGTVTVETLPDGDRGFTVLRGALDVQTSEPIGAAVTVGGEFSASVRGRGVFNGPIHYQTAPGGGFAHLAGGVFNGSISGDTALWLGGGSDGVTLNAANDLRGTTTVVGGVVFVNNPKAINTPNTRIEGGELRYKVPVVGQPVMGQRPGNSTPGRVVLTVDQELPTPWAQTMGDLRVEAEVLAQEMILIGGDQLAELSAANDGAFRVGGELRSEFWGRITAPLVGDGVVRGRGYQTILEGDLSRFAGRLVAEGGQMSISSPSSLSPSATIEVRGGATLRVFGDEVEVASDIHLEGGRADAGADLVAGNFSDDQVYTGDLHVGPRGARTSGTLMVAGDIHGPALTHNGGGMQIVSAVTGLTDKLTALGGVTVAENGSIRNVQEIVIGPDGSLFLPQSGNPDRLGDDITIRTHGGQFSLISGSQHQTSERLGRVHAERGRARIVASSDHSGTLPVGLSIGEIRRDPGAVVSFVQAGRQTTALLENAETFDGVMLGAGFLYDGATSAATFAALDATNQVVALQSTASALATANESDHVQMASDETLSADATVASITVLRQLDLNGHTLRVRSGGVIGGGRIAGGSLTAGVGQEPSELLFHGGVQLEAHVIDNQDGGPVTLVLADNATLSGTNRYTGGTILSGSGRFSSRDVVRIATPDAVPNRDRLQVHSARYEFGGVFDRDVVYESVEITGGGAVSAGTNRVRFDHVLLEEGTFSADPVGDGVITKTGPHLAALDLYSGDDFTGQIVVNEGQLNINRDTPTDSTAVINGGRLSVDQWRGGELRLRGGEYMFNAHRGDLYIDAPSVLAPQSHRDSWIEGALIGRGDITIRGEVDRDYSHGVLARTPSPEFEGDVYVESGMLVLSSAGAVGDARITVDGGGQLMLRGMNATTPTSVDNAIELRGGVLHSFQPIGFNDDRWQTNVVSGHVRVTASSFIGATNHAGDAAGLDLQGVVQLEPGVTVLGLSDNRHWLRSLTNSGPVVELSGELLVGSNTAWNVLTTTLAVTGTITSEGVDGAIDFRGSTEQIDLSAATLVARVGEQLTVTVNGESDGLELGALMGEGTLVGDYRLTDGGFVAPGESPGELTLLGDLTIASGTRYEWELTDASGAAGEAWDLLDVEGVLRFDATPEAPWLLSINPATERLLTPGEEWLIASAGAISGFDTATYRIGWPVGPGAHTDSDAFTLQQRGSDLYLVRAIPEPHTACLTAMVLLHSVAARGWRRCRIVPNSP